MKWRFMQWIAFENRPL